jgi:hypothetical protein
MCKEIYCGKGKAVIENDFICKNMRKKFKIYIVIWTILLFVVGGVAMGQQVPAAVENIPYLMTFGSDGEISWGDDDFSQTFFFKVPTSYTKPFYIRVYDPDIGGDVDEAKGPWDTRMSYTVYGGFECCSTDDAKSTDPTGGYRDGVMLASKEFGMDNRYDDDWYTFGPFNPSEGELIEEFGGYIFKVIAEGVSGDDGNLYRYFLSEEADRNSAIQNGNAFTYEYSFRMWNNLENISHIYPYVDSLCIWIQTTNFDWDDDGVIRITSNVRRGQLQDTGGESETIVGRMSIRPGELNSSLNFEFIKKDVDPPIRNNNVVISIQNQYGETLPFFVVPIGGVPVYKVEKEWRKKN